VVRFKVIRGHRTGKEMLQRLVDRRANQDGVPSSFRRLVKTCASDLTNLLILLVVRKLRLKMSPSEALLLLG